MRKTLGRACTRAGVPRFTAHGLRRLAVDAMVRSGVDVATAAGFLGHSVSVMLGHYRQVSREDKRQALASTGLAEVPRGEVVPFPGAAEAGGEEG